jgi:hypothetical protein
MMSFTPVLLTSVLLASQIQPTFAGAHDAYLASVSTYRPMAGFNHLVGPTRFVGYFLQTPDACRVTVFKAEADDESLLSPPERIELYIAAADRRELAAGDGSALAVACAADADTIKVAPQQRDWSASR